MQTLITALHVLAALAIIVLVLLQHGKGADVGAAFGSGSAGSVFGSGGSANFLSRTTAVLAVIFFVTSMGLTYISVHQTGHKGVMATQPAPAKPQPGDIPVPTVSPDKPVAAPDGSRAGEVPK